MAVGKRHLQPADLVHISITHHLDSRYINTSGLLSLQVELATVSRSDQSYHIISDLSDLSHHITTHQVFT